MSFILHRKGHTDVFTIRGRTERMGNHFTKGKSKMIKRYYNNYKRNIFIKCIGYLIIATLTILLMYNVDVAEISKPAKCAFSVAFAIPVLLIFILIFPYCIQFWNVRRSIKAQDYQLIQRNGISYLQTPSMCISIDECGKVIILDDY